MEASADEMMASIALAQPATATWSSGVSTTVSAQLGLPSSVCEGEDHLTFDMPLRLTSADGRVNLDRSASACAGFDSGLFDFAWVHAGDYSLPAKGFAASSGISGVNLGAFAGASWHSTLDLKPWDGLPRGEVVITGITADGDHDDDVVERLDWSLE